MGCEGGHGSIMMYMMPDFQHTESVALGDCIAYRSGNLSSGTGSVPSLRHTIYGLEF